MTEKKKNQFKNKLKEEEEPIVEPKKVKRQKRNFFLGIVDSFQWVKNEKFQRVLGLFLLLTSVYMLVAFASFVFTWEVDQDKMMLPLSDLFSPDIKVINWLGKLGALLSHQFIHKWFGMTAFVFPFLFFILGFSLVFKVILIPIVRTIQVLFFVLLWLSITLGYAFGDSFFYLGGGVGFVISKNLVAIVGSVGTASLLVFMLLTFFVLFFNTTFNWFLKKEKIDQPIDLPNQEIIQEKELPKNILKEELSSATHVMELDIDTSQTIDLSEDKQINFEQKPDDTLDPKEELVLTGNDDIQFTVETTPEEKKEEEVIEVGIKETDLVAQFGEYDPTLDLSSYQFPPVDLLEQYGNKDITVNTEELTDNKNRIVATLANYGIEIEKIKATIGPTVTLYEINPAAGVRISKIKNLEDDIALSLSALGIRIIAPIPGKGTIGIEVPNQNPEMVAMRTIIASDKFQNTNMDLPIALGKTISNETFIADLAKMPHLLMAGATGQGKSVGLNAILVSLLYKKHPSQIKFVLVDPKKVELTLFNKIERHFLAKLPDTAEAIITDTKKVVHTLNSLCIEMDQRYDLLKDAQVRNLKEYNAKFISRKLNPNNGHRYLPYIVLVVDEFADLIMTAGKEVETPIARLAQLARAIGIHLIIATQRPSVNIITGTIKANFPARIAFRVTSKIDSRTILDAGGAEQLIGRGDMLLSTGSDLIRLQCAFVDTPEVDKITDFIGSQRSYPEAYKLPEYVGEGDEVAKGDLDPGDRDALFAEAASIIVQHQQGSASLLQRRLKLGYNRAGRIIDQLEAAGIIGPFEGSKAREVLIKDALSLEQFLNNQKNNN